MTKQHLDLSHLREHNLEHSFQGSWNHHVSALMLNQLSYIFISLDKAPSRQLHV